MSNSLLLYTPSLLLVINHSPSLSLLCLSLCLFLLFFDLLLLTLFYSVLFSSYFFSRSPLLFFLKYICYINAETMSVLRIFYAVFIQFIFNCETTFHCISTLKTEKFFPFYFIKFFRSNTYETWIRIHWKKK